jgi:ATP-dependent helicase HrpA
VPTASDRSPRADRRDAAAARLESRRAAVPARIAYPPELPVSARREELLAAIREHQVVIVAGETGSGKTTQLPKLCLELGRGVDGMIAHTQPRRIAARTVAARIAHELHVPLGDAVGYAVRFNDRSGERTLVRLMTDGLLLAEIQHDRLLRRYNTIIVDEAHERSLNIDFLLGCLTQILPRRPELKLIVTSATIDPQRFSAHFGGAPIVEVSGRTYPVETRYRPSGQDIDQAEAIADAVDELLREAAGDVLVFLSGEREIRDTAELLRGRLGGHVEVLPLYARLSSAEQQRVFEPHARRRVVLATNVAETSLTVPGIRAVVDPGTARISRYSARLKVQRLPIEPISQASADQRKGRCGRTSDGVCIRLYDEDDFAARPRFTDPEILRTSLASVILQMAALGLGEVEEFPFLDPPDRRQVRDGVLLLQELGALDEHKQLTPLGRRLARLPVDPRLGRIVLEAGRLGCAEEAIVIAAALSIQDPRERPAEQQEAADRMHDRFTADEHDSDFLALLNLWRHLRHGRRELSGNQFRKRCREEFLHYLRVREWQDLVGQLRQAVKAAGVTMNETPAEPRELHVALLSGLLSHVGMKDARGREYEGARGARFQLSPGSALASRGRAGPDWVVVAELVETTRLWGRTAARIDPRWIEGLAGHLLKRSYGEPRWDPRRGAAVANERATLYGLPVVAERRVAYGRIDPEHARMLFIRHALLEGNWDGRHAFLAENRRRLAEAEELEHRARRRDIVVGEEALVAFYDARIPPQVVSGTHFDRWWREAGARDPELLTFPRELLVDAEAAGAVDERAWPRAWRADGLVLALSHRFEPGSAHDGVTVSIPLAALGQVRADGFEWLVPGLRAELITTLLRALPKELRRPLVPLPDLAAQLAARLGPDDGPLLDALARALEQARGVQVPPGTWELARLPAHLRMRFRVEDEEGGTIAEGDDLAALRATARPRLQASLAAAAPQLERTGLHAWTIGTLPREVVLDVGAGGELRGYPALVDEGESAGVRVLDTPDAQAAAMLLGTRRLLLATMPSTVRFIREHIDSATQLALASAPHGSLAALLDDALAAALDALIARVGGPAWDEASFAQLRAHVAGEVAQTTATVLAQVAAILAAAREVEARLDALRPTELQPARLDIARQLGRLLFPGFVAAAGVARLPDVERYLRAAARRVERLPSAPGADAERMRTVNELEELYERRRTSWPRERQPPAALLDLRWLLEELRVSLFAQALGTRVPVSPKRVRQALDAVA